MTDLTKIVDDLSKLTVLQAAELAKMCLANLRPVRTRKQDTFSRWRK